MKKVLLLSGVLAFAGCEVNLNSEGIVSRETKRFEVTGTPEVQLDTFDGSIEVHSWDRNEVEIEVEKRAMEQRLVDEMQVTAEQQGNRIVFKVSDPGRGEDGGGVRIGVHFSPTARLRVALPRNTNLTAISGDGSVAIEDVSGTLQLQTRDGSVRASRVGGAVTVRSGDGSIRVDRAEGALDLETDDGSITLDAKPTMLRARTGDGSIRLEIAPGAEMNGDWDLQTGDGSIVLRLPSAFNGVLDAESRDGAVRVSHPSIRDEERTGDRRDERRRMLQATLGSGGHTVRVRTGDGTIRIE